jgi:hypothetical protein
VPTTRFSGVSVSLTTSQPSVSPSSGTSGSGGGSRASVPVTLSSFMANKGPRVIGQSMHVHFSVAAWAQSPPMVVFRIFQPHRNRCFTANAEEAMTSLLPVCPRGLHRHCKALRVEKSLQFDRHSLCIPQVREGGTLLYCVRC